VKEFPQSKNTRSNNHANRIIKQLFIHKLFNGINKSGFLYRGGEPSCRKINGVSKALIIVMYLPACNYTGTSSALMRINLSSFLILYHRLYVGKSLDGNIPPQKTQCRDNSNAHQGCKTLLTNTSAVAFPLA